MGRPTAYSRQSAAVILYVVATADEPLTVEEVADILDNRKQNISVTLLRLYRTGLLVRRKRDTKLGADPYEYAIAPPGDYHFPEPE